MNIINYVLVDLENIQPSNFSILASLNYRVMVFVGSSQNKISFEFADAMQSLGDRAEYIKIEGNGKNALDFHIAFRLGQLSTTTGVINYFHIVSKDTGFDPLIKFMTNQEMKVQRIQDISEIKMVQALMATSVEDQMYIVIDNLNSRSSAKPKSLDSLVNTIKSIFGHTIEEITIQKIVDSLISKKHLAVEGKKIVYAS